MTAIAYDPSRLLTDLWTTVGGIQMYARAAYAPAPARRIILVHGLGISSRYMLPTLVRLARQYCVFAPDLPGFGRSQKPRHALNIERMADALAGWMNQNGLDHATLLGNSLGCQVIVDLAVRYPQSVDRLILSSPTIDARARSSLTQIARVIADAPREKFSLNLLALSDYLEVGIPRVLATLHHALEDRIEQKLPAVDVPTLVVAGQRDPIVPVSWAAHVASLLPRGRLVVLPGCAHGTNYSCPDLLVGEVERFLIETV